MDNSTQVSFEKAILEVTSLLRNYINDSCKGLEAWQIVILSVLTTLLAIYIGRPLLGVFDEDFVQKLLRFLRSLPIVKQKVQKQLDGHRDSLERSIQGTSAHRTYLQHLPKNGLSKDDVMSEIKKYLSYGKFSWSDGYVSGTVYHGKDAELYQLVKDVYGCTSYTNPLHPEVFPAIRIMEAEIVRMVASLYNCKDAFGTVSSGGTESIFLVCKAYRDYAKDVRGITKPNMVVPVTVHAAFDKAAQILKIQCKHIPFDPKTTKVDIRAMKKAINRNTCMLVGSAPAFPHGSIDPIEEIGKLGVKYNIPVHVDCCLGGFLLPFMKKAGHSVPSFDFTVKGVTSISCDTHKYAYAPKGTSVVLYRERLYRHYQFTVQPNWPGGIYGTPNLSGSRSGGIVATCWASLLFHGEDKYVESTRKIISTTKYIEEGLRKIEGIHIIGQPEVSVVAIGSGKFDIFQLNHLLTKQGWNLNLLQFPSGIHICVTLQHTEPGVADRFLADVKKCSTELLKNPNLPTEEGAAIYGTAQKIPDRSIVSELVWAYLDACYSTKVIQSQSDSQ